jgi:ribosomal protein S1
MTTETTKDLDFWRKNAEDDYITTPISVLRYIAELEQQVKYVDLADVVGSLPLVEIDKDVLKTCVEMYKTGDRITAVKWLIEEAKKPAYTFGIKWAKEYLDKQ